MNTNVILILLIARTCVRVKLDVRKGAKGVLQRTASALTRTRALSIWNVRKGLVFSREGLIKSELWLKPEVSKQMNGCSKVRPLTAVQYKV